MANDHDDELEDDQQETAETANFRLEEEQLSQREAALARAGGFLSVYNPELAQALAMDPDHEDALAAVAKFDEAAGETLVTKIREGNAVLERRSSAQEAEIAADARGQRLAELRAERQERAEEERRRSLDAELLAQLDEEENPQGTPPPSASPEEQIYRQFDEVMDQFNALAPTDLEGRAALADKGIELAQQLEVGTRERPVTFDTAAFLEEVNRELEEK